MDAKVKERVIRIATDLFLRHGIKAITMDYIAGQLGMSKRTLYEIFKDKDSLLLSCVQYVDEERAKDAEEIKKRTSNSIELFLSVYQRSLQKLRCTNQNYFSDLKKYHPSVFVYYEANKEKNLQNFIVLLEQGMNEGYIRKELNVEIISFLLSAQLELLIKSNDIYLNKYSFMEVFETIVMNFVRGIATPKGVAFIDEFVNRNSIYLKSATKLFSVLLASKRPLITELADKLRLKYPLLPTISPCPTMRLEAIRSIIPISCRRYPKSV